MTFPTKPSPPFSLRIFVADGDPDGLRLVERSNWIGKGVMFPRAVLPQVRQRSEFNQTGVYMLLGPSTERDGEMLYVGEGDPVRPRLDSHFANKDFWTHAVFFVAGQGLLNKAHVQYLEAQLILRAKNAKRVQLDNATSPDEPTLSEADRADMDVFLENMLGMLPLLGIHAFEASATSSAYTIGEALICHGRGVKASGYDTPQGFVVRKGSQAAGDEVPSLKEHFPNVSRHRVDLLKSGALAKDGIHLVFTQDYTFNSPSLASSAVLGRSSNGRVDWKDANGRTLREIQESQAKSLPNE